MPALAADLLEAGYDTPSLRRLAGEMQFTCAADAEPLVARVFHELNVPYPISERQAKLVAARQIAREVIAGIKDPWEAAHRLEVRVCNWIPEESELETIFSIADESDWDAPYGRPAATLHDVLLETFALLAIMPDERISPKSKA